MIDELLAKDDEHTIRRKISDYVLMQHQLLPRQPKQVKVEPEVKPEIAEILKKRKQEYLRWLTLPRYQPSSSDEFYADIQTITEDLQALINKIE